MIHFDLLLILLLLFLCARESKGYTGHINHRTTARSALFMAVSEKRKKI